MEIDAQDKNGDTPLHIAAKGGFTGIIKCMLEAGASASAANNAGQKPVDCAGKSAAGAFGST